MNVQRLNGLAVALFGALLLVWLIPANTERVDYGWLRPQTLPQICAVALVVLGLILAIRPVPGGELGAPPLRLVLVIGLTVLALWGMSRFGFLWVAPILAAALIALIGERRPHWIALGLVLAPVCAWLVVVLLLNRTLP